MSLPDLVPVRRALLSVSDKSGLIDFAKALASRGVTILSTGGTAASLRAAGVAVTSVEDTTGFPEGLDGRVKTLHPRIHGALLALRDNPAHRSFLAEHGIEPIDLVAINLYPFEKTVARAGVTREDAIENIDIGGPAMIRAAAKNHAFVTVITNPEQYDRVLAELDAHKGSTSQALRAGLAVAAFARTAEYDAAIAAHFAPDGCAAQAFPNTLTLRLSKLQDLRYGENPHQRAALYANPTDRSAGIVNARQLHGKELSYNNINDAAWAFEAVRSLARVAAASPSDQRHAAVVVKHTNPCGGALAASPSAAIRAAVAGDPTAAYGGILAFSSPLTTDSANAITDKAHFFEVVIAPEFDTKALTLLKARWTQVRLLQVAIDLDAPSSLELRSVPGGMLAQERDSGITDPTTWRHVAGPKPTASVLQHSLMLETLCRCVTSNAVVLGGFDAHTNSVRLFGIGSGQVDRVSACRLAASKAGPLARGSIAVGDAFFPFADGPEVLIAAGVSTIVHPGGSKRDQDTIDLCERHGVTCLLSGVRRFRH